jgi:hypothetical protein
LTERFGAATGRFEVVGADAAGKFLLGEGAAAERRTPSKSPPTTSEVMPARRLGDRDGELEPTLHGKWGQILPGKHH